MCDQEQEMPGQYRREEDPMRMTVDHLVSSYRTLRRENEARRLEQSRLNLCIADLEHQLNLAKAGRSD